MARFLRGAKRRAAMKMRCLYFAVALSIPSITALGLSEPPASNAKEPSPAAHVDEHGDSHSAEPKAKPDVSETPSPEDALRMLIEGNERYLTSQTEHPHSNAARRRDTFTNGQHPIASILSCADSR